jgi:L-serine deaminase
MGAITAINAAELALKRPKECQSTLDKVVNTMWETGT